MTSRYAIVLKKINVPLMHSFCIQNSHPCRNAYLILISTVWEQSFVGIKKIYIHILFYVRSCIKTYMSRGWALWLIFRLLFVILIRKLLCDIVWKEIKCFVFSFFFLVCFIYKCVCDLVVYCGLMLCVCVCVFFKDGFSFDIFCCVFWLYLSTVHTYQELWQTSYYVQNY